ncbi:RagB/SusD family nutrient uptake outer membrane protein [Niabella sp. 22666]|uniref:RagB/SusD family nutrient uptake outer membrane protein n=1 Tax=Niabella sp. 22666 TaxID=3453954 RepID=UPI003F87BEED
MSCKKYFEVDLSDRNTVPKTFSTIEGFRAALAGTYTTAHKYYSSVFYIYPEVAGNMVEYSGTAAGGPIDQFNFVSNPQTEIGTVGYIWRYTLTTIANANNIIEYYPIFLESNQSARTELDLIKAQALFIRAMAHFDLCRVYAQPYNYTADASHLGVPVVVKNPAPEDIVTRATVKEVYTQIIADLKEAEQLFGNGTVKDSYFASKKAAQALLARVYLYAQDWDAAINYATQVITTSPLAYNADYIAMYNNLIPGVESIFRLNGTLLEKTIGINYSPTTPVITAADTLIKLFDQANDIRFTALFQSGIRYRTKKWWINVPFNSATERYDPIVLRTSEMYFIRAEANLAKNNIEAASNDLKVIIARALNKTPGEITLTTTDKSVLEKTITEERAKEFCFEGHNFFDIVRRKQNLVRSATTLSTVKTINYPSDYFVLPIPQSELDANPAMKGNPTVNN